MLGSSWQGWLTDGRLGGSFSVESHSPACAGSAISPPAGVPLASQASGAGCGRRRAPTYAGAAGARVAARRRPAHTRPQRPRLRQRGQRLRVREQRQRRRRRRRRGRGRGRDALPGPSGPVEVQLEGGGPREAEQRAPEPWPHFREEGGTCSWRSRGEPVLGAPL